MDPANLQYREYLTPTQAITLFGHGRAYFMAQYKLWLADETTGIAGYQEDTKHGVTHTYLRVASIRAHFARLESEARAKAEPVRIPFRKRVEQWRRDKEAAAASS